MEELEAKLKAKIKEKKDLIDKANEMEATRTQLQQNINQCFLDAARIEGQVTLLMEMIDGLKPKPVVDNTPKNPEKPESEAK